MREKIQNNLKIVTDDIDLTEISNIEFYVRQVGFFACYKPVVLSPTEMVVIIPASDAQRLRKGNADLQFAFVDKNGSPDASEVKSVPVKAQLKEAGYDPI